MENTLVLPFRNKWERQETQKTMVSNQVPADLQGQAWQPLQYQADLAESNQPSTCNPSALENKIF
jgi:hypothetical protein